MPVCTFAELVQHDVTDHKKSYMSIKKACETMGHNHLLMVEAVNTYTIDCMGQEVVAMDVCKTTYPDEKTLIRGYVEARTNEVVCEKGTSVTIGIGCDKRDRDYCKQPVEGCEKIRKLFANSLKLGHHSMINKDIDDVLNCYFITGDPLPGKDKRLEDLISDPLEEKIWAERMSAPRKNKPLKKDLKAEL